MSIKVTSFQFKTKSFYGCFPKTFYAIKIWNFFSFTNIISNTQIIVMKYIGWYRRQRLYIVCTYTTLWLYKLPRSQTLMLSLIYLFFIKTKLGTPYVSLITIFTFNIELFYLMIFRVGQWWRAGNKGIYCLLQLVLK